MPLWPVLQGGLDRSARGERPALIRSEGGKKALVDELVVITGYRRKSVLRALNRKPIPADGDGAWAEPYRHHRCRYGPEVMEALVPLREASDRLCGKRLQALLPLHLESLERHGHLVLDPEVREKLITISSAMIDRMLAPVRKTSPGNGWRKPPRVRSAVQRRTPVRTFNGWGECLTLLSRDGASVMAAMRMLEELLPFPLRGIDVDNDGAFLNAPLEQWCEKHQPPIALTRSRAYQSNDQAWVEQKNGMLIRRAAGGAVRGAATVHQPLPALVQAQGDDPRGRQTQAASPPTAHAAAAVVGAR